MFFRAEGKSTGRFCSYSWEQPVLQDVSTENINANIHNCTAPWSWC